jgi:hypothetical protein
MLVRGRSVITRTLPEGSWVEIANYRNRLNTELCARAYFYEKKGYIVSAVSGITETGEPTILPPDVSSSRCRQLRFGLQGLLHRVEIGLPVAPAPRSGGNR